MTSTERRNHRQSLALRAFMVLAAVAGGAALLSGQQAPASRSGLDALLVPTSHPPLPSEPSLYWFVPQAGGGRSTAARPLDAGARRLRPGRPVRRQRRFLGGALAHLRPGHRRSQPRQLRHLLPRRRADRARPLRRGDGRRCRCWPRARSTARSRRLAALQLAEAALARNTPERVEAALAALTLDKLANPEDVWLMRARVEDAVGHRDARARIVSPPLLRLPAEHAGRGGAGGDRASAEPRGPCGAVRAWSGARRAVLQRQALGRREDGVFGADRRAPPTSAIWWRCGSRRRTTTLATAVRRARRSGRCLDSDARGAEARYISLLATQGAGRSRRATPRQARELVTDFPGSPWAEEALNGLGHGSHHLRRRRRGGSRLPRTAAACSRAAAMRSARRGKWAGASYRAGEFSRRGGDVRVRRRDDAPRRQPPGVALLVRPLPRSSRRRRHGQRALPAGRGRLSEQLLRTAGVEDSGLARRAGDAGADHGHSARRRSAPVVETDDIIRSLLTAQMYGEALREVQYAQRVWGDSPQLQATSAWIRHQQGLTLTADERFAALRGAITTMRRAYPQFMAAGGEALPADVLRIIFPLDYWPLITKYSEQHQLDPYLIAALMAQESTFTAEIRSHANAYGLMQIIPSTGRRYAASWASRRSTRPCCGSPR